MLTGHETLQQAAFSCLELTFVPVCSRQAGEGRHDARLTLVLPGCIHALTPPRGACVSQQGRYELAGTVVTAETGNFQPFPSAWKKPKDRLRSSNLLPVSLRQLQFDMLGRGRVLQGSRDTGEEAQGFVWAGTGGSALLQRLDTLFAQQT